MDGSTENRSVELTAEELLPRLEAWFASGCGPFPLTVTGNSMRPFTAPGRDVVYLEPLREPPRVGDILLCVSGDRAVLHRVRDVTDDAVVTIGDAYSAGGERFALGDIAAVCSSVRRKGKIYDEKSPYWLFFSRVWIHIVPVRKTLIRSYNKIKGRGTEK